MKPIRFLFLNHNVVRWGGTFFRAFDIARHLVRRGHSVTLLSISTSERWRSSIEIADGVEIVHTPDLFWRTGRSGWDPWDALWRTRLVSGRRWDIVHAWDTRPVVILPALAARFFSRREGARLVIDWSDWSGRGGTQLERGGGWTRYLYNAVETFFEEQFRRFADRSTVISNVLRERAMKLGVPAGKILLLPQGCEPPVIVSEATRRAARAELGLRNEEHLFITVGVLNVGDGRFLFEALREAIPRIAGGRYALIGRLRIPVPPDLKAKGVEEVGFVSDDLLNTYMAAADALVVPLADNVSSRGRWPSRVNPALSHGLPVVITRVGDLPRLLERERAGFVSAPDSSAFVDAMARAAGDAAAARDVAMAGRRVAAEFLPWSKVIDGLEDFYETVLERNANTDDDADVIRAEAAS